ncbi:hypothetical protein DFH08DRAFT_810162 [Mycena albidolilacea]|uniref:Uncharacterized protein n=1 Tax=Mycena albidolilacea TaxID=1033008 RepID=A0AAD6ZZ68_9AGAR|nr:hypothetical protein DFH08DRAFT_810162 [Mycena albidolilacea]
MLQHYETILHYRVGVVDSATGAILTTLYYVFNGIFPDARLPSTSSSPSGARPTRLPPHPHPAWITRPHIELFIEVLPDEPVTRFHEPEADFPGFPTQAELGAERGLRAGMAKMRKATVQEALDVVRDPALAAPGIEAAHGCPVCETRAGPALADFGVAWARVIDERREVSRGRGGWGSAAVIVFRVDGWIIRPLAALRRGAIVVSVIVVSSRRVGIVGTCSLTSACVGTYPSLASASGLFSRGCLRRDFLSPIFRFHFCVGIWIVLCLVNALRNELNSKCNYIPEAEKWLCGCELHHIIFCINKTDRRFAPVSWSA